jgi:hypothetical protein
MADYCWCSQPKDIGEQPLKNDTKANSRAGAAARCTIGWRLKTLIQWGFIPQVCQTALFPTHFLKMALITRTATTDLFTSREKKPD